MAQYAVIALGGKQYRVREGERIVVDRIAAEPGESISPKVIATGTADGITDGSEVVDCKGMCLTPGFIDMQVFLGESVDTTAKAAAAGGCRLARLCSRARAESISPAASDRRARL